MNRVQLEDAIWIKNCEIRNIKTGVVAVDRAPLDFIAFPTKRTETLGTTARKRASAVLERLKISKLRDLCPGQVVVLQTDIEVLLARQLQRGGRTTPSEVKDGSARRYLKRQQERLGEIYKVSIDAGSVAKTDRCSIALTVKAIARIIHFGNYKPFDFAKRLRAIKKGK